MAFLPPVGSKRFVQPRIEFTKEEDTAETTSMGPAFPPPPQRAGYSGERPPEESSSGLEKIAQLIPAEIVAFYIGAIAILENSEDLKLQYFAGWLCFGAGVVITFFYFLRGAGGSDRFGLAHASLSTASFVIWAYALGGPFKWSFLNQTALYHASLSALLILAFTTLSGIIPLPTRKKMM